MVPSGEKTTIDVLSLLVQAGAFGLLTYMAIWTTKKGIPMVLAWLSEARTAIEASNKEGRTAYLEAAREARTSYLEALATQQQYAREQEARFAAARAEMEARHQEAWDNERRWRHAAIQRAQSAILRQDKVISDIDARTKVLLEMLDK